MKAIKRNQHLFPLLFILFISLSFFCVNKSYSNLDIKQAQVNDSTQYSGVDIDSSFRLKYKTGIRSILEDSKGNFWFGSNQEGVCCFDGKKLTYYTVADGLSDNQIRSIYEDANGIVWFEGGKGISSYNGKKISTSTEKNYSFKNVWQTDKNDLWFKGDEATGYNKLEGQPGVYRYDGNTFNFLVFPITAKKNENSYYSVSTAFAKGKNGRFWFGTYGATVGFDGTSFIVIDNKSLGLNEETGYLHIRSLYEDSKGNLWIGNNGIGVLLYDGDTTINFSKSHGLISEKSLHSGGYKSPQGSLEHVFAIGEDSDGILWFGDRDTGAWRYDGKSFKNFTTKNGLTTTHIWQIYKNKKGDLWFAMDDGSVCKFNGESFDRIF